MKIAQSEYNKGHEIVGTYLYGPVNSRRYGRSLGINLLPQDKKLCNFNCVYCQLGKNDPDERLQQQDFPALNDVLAEIEQGYQQLQGAFDSVVVSGNGEPTLFPQFNQLSARLNELNRRQKASLSCFTNGTTLTNPAIFEALRLYDECCVKLDPGLKRVDIPYRGFDLNKMLAAARGLDNLVFQSCIFEGRPGNDDADSIEEWLTWFDGLQPRRIDLYTIARNTAIPGLKPVSEHVLTGLAEKLALKGFTQVRVTP